MTAQSVDVPLVTVVLRKGYGLGAQGMAGGSFWAPDAHRVLADRRVRRHGPGGRGQARVAQRARGDRGSGRARAEYERRVAQMYEQGKALSTASLYEIDDVIDPVDTRRVIVETLRAAPPRRRGPGRSGRASNTW